ncbi:MAG: UbiD family decarboxylase [Deltaproteobacteria bacterium]|nr:UbiD family decarboxylase [Deltaproteobacteria bacterium]
MAIEQNQESDLRSYLTGLEKAGKLARIKKQVNPRHEIAGVMLKAAQQGKPALLFENVKGHDIPVAANLCASRERLAMALGVPAETARDVYRERVSRPLPAEKVRSGACQEEVFSSVDLTRLPIITAHELDAGPYITAGVIIVKDPRSGVYNASFQRILPLTKNRAAIYIGRSSDLMRCYQESGDNPLPVAIAIGLHPTFLLAAAVKFPFHVSEIEVAGGLREEPVRMVTAVSVPLDVPASAEIILEGRLLPRVTEAEGPFGEYTGYYGAGSIAARQSQVIEFTALTHRRRPIYQALTSGPTLGHESSYLSCLAKEAIVLQAAMAVSPAVERVNIMLSRYIAVIQVNDKRRKGDVSQIMAAAFSAMEYLKYVVLVDEDVDIESYSDVFWAISTRVDPGRDLLIFPKMRMEPLDPSTEEMCDKVGIDATVPLDRKEGFKRTAIPNFDEIDLDDYLP